MRTLMATLALLLTGEARAAALETIPCPFAREVATHITACSRFTREDDGAKIALDVAVLIPRARQSTGRVVYIPGGPGEAPVSENGLFDDLLIPFDDRTIILFNPRGTLNTEPRMECDFGELIWDEEFGDAASQKILQECIDRFERDGPDPERFTSLEIAEDIDVLIRTLGIDRAGIYGISYGTEAALHLIALAPPWLGYALIDSVSVPGLSGVIDEIRARDRFLAMLDRLCFAEERCSAFARDDAGTLTEWAAQFDANPLTIYLRDNVNWWFESTDILDYLSQLGAYRDGLDLAIILIELLETGRLAALGWIRSDVVSNTEFTAISLPLLLQAYSDTFDPADVDTVRKPTQYVNDVENAVQQLELYRIWRGARPREAFFLTGEPEPVGMPVLMLSGGADPFTPVEWARALHARFSGVEHYIFPHLGHGVTVGIDGVWRLPESERQSRCASGVVRAFLNPTLKPDEACDAYRTGNDK